MWGGEWVSFFPYWYLIFPALFNEMSSASLLIWYTHLSRKKCSSMCTSVLGISPWFHWVVCRSMFSNQLFPLLSHTHKKPWFIISADLCGINTPTRTSFKLATWRHRIQSCKEILTIGLKNRVYPNANIKLS